MLAQSLYIWNSDRWLAIGIKPAIKALENQLFERTQQSVSLWLSFVALLWAFSEVKSLKSKKQKG